MARRRDLRRLMSPDEAAEAQRGGTETIAFGALLVCAGLLAVLSPVWAAVAAVTALGLALVLGAIAYVARATRGGRAPNNLFIGILAGIAGLILVARPIAAAEALTLLVAAFLLTAGVARVVPALMARHAQWRWSLVNGGISIVLGLILFAQWPAASRAVIGVLVGLELLVSGGLMIGAVLAARRLVSDLEAERRREAEERPPPVH